MLRINQTRTRLLTIVAALLLLLSAIPAAQPALASPARQVPQWMIFQQFESGVMLADGNSVTVLANVDQVLQFPKTVYEPLMDFVFSGAPPTTLGARQPTGAFGKLWKNLPELRAKLGWAIGNEVNYQANVGGGMGLHINLPNNRPVKYNMGVLSQPNLALKQMNGGTLDAALGVWNYEDPNPNISPCQSPYRIAFAPGGITGAASSNLGGTCPTQSYVLRALAGQQMTVTLVGQGPLTGMLTLPTGETAPVPAVMDAAGTSLTRTLPATGDYTFTISQTDPNANSYYTLAVTVVGQITAPPPVVNTCAPTSRIQFAPGAVSAYMNGTSTVACPRSAYVFWALAGQRVVIQVSSGGPMIGTLTSGTASLATGVSNSGASMIDTIIPATGDYYISLSQDSRYAGWDGQYTLILAIY